MPTAFKTTVSLFLALAIITLHSCGATIKNSAQAGDDNDCTAETDIIHDNVIPVEPYIVADNCAGPFRIGGAIPDKVDGFVRSESVETKTIATGATIELLVYIYEIGNEGWVKITPLYDSTTGCTNNDVIGEIFVYSDLFMTDRGIGAMSSIEDFASVYPDFNIRYERETGLFVAETSRLGNVQFIINDWDYQGVDSVFTSGGQHMPQLSDFKAGACFAAIRITK